MEKFAGTWRLTKLALRRDRIKLPVWIVAIAGFLALLIPALKESYPTQTNWATYYELVSTSAVTKLFAGNVDEISFGAIVTAETLLYIALAVAFMNTLLVVRHTRQNEDIGSAELLQSARVGRFASLSAALIVALIANVAVTIGLALALSSNELITTSGAWLYAVGVGALGLAFAAIAGITAQLSGASRGANSLAAMVIGATFLLRGIGDVMANTAINGVIWPNWISWLSPFGWLQLTRPLTLEYWWPLILPLLFSILAVGIAYRLMAKRDVGSGLLPARKGKPRASKFLRRPIGLAVRLQKGIFIGWGIAAVILATTMGVLSQEAVDLFGEEGSDVVQQYMEGLGGEGEIIELFLGSMLALTAIMLVAYVVQSLQRLRSEEVSGHLESILGTALGRTKWVMSHALVVGVGSILILLATGMALAISAGVSAGSAVSDWQLGEYIILSMSYLPALLIFAGIVIFSVGVLPKFATALSWLAFIFIIFISQLGAILKLPDWVMNLSPFSHIPALPSERIEASVLINLFLIALALVLTGLIAFRKRDLVTS